PHAILPLFERCECSASCNISRLRLFFAEASVALRDLHSFPTRRSSDLELLRRAGGRDADATRAGRFSAGDPFRGVLDHNAIAGRSEEHTSELQSRGHLVCRLLLEKKTRIHISFYPLTRPMRPDEVAIND